MKLFANLKKLVSLLAPWDGNWAICGGVAAAIYRDTPRYTGDIDVVLTDAPEKTAEDIAEIVVRQMGYKPIPGWVTDNAGKLIPAKAMIVGREDEASGYVGIDLLLPVLPWIPDAVARAQVNKLDFGFSKLPTITPEDLLIAKMLAFQGSPGRVNDLDDMLAITRSSISIDMSYLRSKIEQYSITAPAELLEWLKKSS